MKKTLILVSLFLFNSVVIGQQSFVETSLVINIEVPVRVFKDNSFVSNLTINDFELLENGVKQKLDAVYLVRGKNIERKEEKRKFVPVTSRTFFLLFELTEYNPRMNDALDFFVKKVLLPGDKVCIVTPMKSYRLIEGIDPDKSKDRILDELKEMLRKDIIEGNPEYSGIIRDLKELARDLANLLQEEVIAGDDEESRDYFNIQEQISIRVMSYITGVTRLETLRRVEQMQLMDFARYLKHEAGRKHVFLFYQREFLPKIDHKILDKTLSVLQDKVYLYQKINELYTFFRKDMSFDVNAISRAFADASLSTHFMFIKKPAEHIQGLSWRRGLMISMGPSKP